MEKQQLWIATENRGKIIEMKKLLPEYDVKTLLDLPQQIEIIEDGETFEQNALIKAKTLAEVVGKNTIGDDSGLLIDGIEGFPGIYSKRWCYPITGDENISKALIDTLNEKLPNQIWTAKMVTSLALFDIDTKKVKIFNGIVKGKISKQVIQTEDGFGYDNVFIPEGYNETYSIMDRKVKLSFSSRSLAFEQLLEYLKGENNG